LCERNYLHQGQRLLLAVLVDTCAWQHDQNDVGTMTNTRARQEKDVAAVWRTLIVTFVNRQFELPRL
jgi:hypothetical protein